jgi:hypothetical protein
LIDPAVASCVTLSTHFLYDIHPRDTLRSNRTLWPDPDSGHFLDIGAFPLDLRLFKAYLKDLRNLFAIKGKFVREAKRR